MKLNAVKQLLCCISNHGRYIYGDGQLKNSHTFNFAMLLKLRVLYYRRVCLCFVVNAQFLCQSLGVLVLVNYTRFHGVNKYSSAKQSSATC